MKHASDSIQEHVMQSWVDAGRPFPPVIADAIQSTQFHTFDGSSLTVCCVLLSDGRSVLASAGGAAAAADIEAVQRTACDHAYAKLIAMGGFTIGNAIAGL